MAYAPRSLAASGRGRTPRVTSATAIESFSIAAKQRLALSYGPTASRRVRFPSTSRDARGASTLRARRDRPIRRAPLLHQRLWNAPA
ncbi:hypothetical protein tb265_41080 [Gemmatimonadetes bacterium T265]|nr:hypothetical protein tb265_41080 [Gemmatimonadetes bacterium T265]